MAGLCIHQRSGRSPAPPPAKVTDAGQPGMLVQQLFKDKEKHIDKGKQTDKHKKSDTDNSTISFVYSIKYERPPTRMNCLEVDHATYYQYGTDLNVQRRPAPR